MKIVKHILTPVEVDQLLAYHRIRDDRTDARPDVVSKHPRWDIDQWPQDIVARLLDRVLDYDYVVQETVFNDSRISFRLHADSGQSHRDRQGHAVLIPLCVDGPSHTVFFDNFWHSDSTKFSKRKIEPFEYNLLNKHSEWQYVRDVRDLLHQANTSPHTIQDFVVDDDFIQSLNTVIKIKKNQGLAKVDNRCYDYSQIENYDPAKIIDQNTYEQYLSHLARETVQGLSIKIIAKWVPTSCIVFERTRLHCASSGHKRKIGITVFTTPKI